MNHINQRMWALLLVLSAGSSTSAMAQWQPLVCFGTEPFWGLDLTEPGRARLSTPDAAAVEYLGSADATVPGQESYWRGRATGADSGALVAVLREGACSDQMSDTLHPYSVEVRLEKAGRFAGCCRLAKASGVATTEGHARLEGDWRLTALPGHALSPASMQNPVTVSFKAGRVQGFSGCNRLIGSYTLEGNRLILGMLGGTMMACPEPAMSLEDHFLKSFSGALIIAMAEDALSLTPASGGDPLQFEPLAPPSLEGIEWEVTGYNNGREAVVSPLTGTRLTLTFEDGNVSGAAGCNRFQGAFRRDQDTLEIGPLATTRMACEDAVMDQEQRFIRALEGARRWDVVAGMLDLQSEDGARMLTASEVPTIPGHHDPSPPRSQR